MTESTVDYYQALQCDRTASTEDLKRSYQRLVLSSHPDKNDGSDEKFILIQKAWSVLRDPGSRKLYDATLACEEHSEILLYDSITLSHMIYDAGENIYTYGCRCGGTYILDLSESMQNSFYIACDECSFSINVKR